MFVETDLERLAQWGISKDEALRQWKLLDGGGRTPMLVRPCTVGDGMVAIAAEDFASLAELHDEAARAGRWMKFVPASGAATRMSSVAPNEVEEICRRLEQFAFYDDLRHCANGQGKTLDGLIASGRYEEVLGLLFRPHGLGYAQLPKLLWEFHRCDKAHRTPLEEHLREATECLASADGRCRAHFTVSEEHREAVVLASELIRRLLREQLGVALDVGVSVQNRATHTLALDQDRQLCRDANGQLLLRPGGHGALLRNVNDLQGDLVFVKNVDNVSHPRLGRPTIEWAKTLGGFLIRIQQAVFSRLQELTDGADAAACDRAEELLSSVFHRQMAVLQAVTGVAGAESSKPQGSGARVGDSAGASKTQPQPPRPPTITNSYRLELLRLLNRPIRVCGMVRNEGEPGGGPYWVRDRDDRETVQIVERAQMLGSNREQLETFAKATHFNPVFMTLGVRDFTGRPFDLETYADPEAVIRTSKTEQGQRMTILERPGLWNGGMAHWNTVFVEVPKAVFSPVKTVMDLLRPEHQPE